MTLYNTDVIKQAIELYGSGLSYELAGAQMGCGTTTVSKIIHQHAPHLMRTNTHYKRNVPQHIRDQGVMLYKTGMSCHKVAIALRSAFPEAHDVTDKVVRRWVNLDAPNSMRTPLHVHEQRVRVAHTGKMKEKKVISPSVYESDFIRPLTKQECMAGRARGSSPCWGS